MDAASRAIPFQAAHAKILRSITPGILQSDDSLRDVRDRAAFLERDYTQAELAITGVQFPMLWRLDNPEHATIIANRADMLDTVNRMDLLLKKRSDDRFWEKHISELEDAARGGSGPSDTMMILAAGAAFILLVLILIPRR